MQNSNPRTTEDTTENAQSEGNAHPAQSLKPVTLDLVACIHCGTPHIWVRGAAPAADNDDGSWLCLLCGGSNPEMNVTTRSACSDQPQESATTESHVLVSDPR